MFRKTLAGIGLALMCAAVVAAQVKEMPKTPNRPISAKIVDINSAPEADIAAIGIEKSVAKQIVDGRPYRSKRELLTRRLLTADEYNKFKDFIIAKQPPKK